MHGEIVDKGPDQNNDSIVLSAGDTFTECSSK